MKVNEIVKNIRKDLDSNKDFKYNRRNEGVSIMPVKENTNKAPQWFVEFEKRQEVFNKTFVNKINNPSDKLDNLVTKNNLFVNSHL